MKLKAGFLVGLCFLMILAQGQVKFRVKKLNADSLVALIPAKKGNELVEALNLLSNVICRKNIDSSINLATQAIELSEKLEYQKGLADGYFNVGNAYFLMDSIHPAIVNYLKAQRIYEDIEPTEEYANLLMQLGVINFFTGKLEVSKPFNRKANSIYKKLNDTIGLYSSDFGMAAYYNELRPLYLDSVIHYCLKAKSYIDTVNDQNKLAYLYLQIGDAHIAQFHDTQDTLYWHDALAWNYNGQALTGINDDIKLLLYLNAMYLYDSFNTGEAFDSLKAIFNKVLDIYDSQAYSIDNEIVKFWWSGSIKFRENDIDAAINLWNQFLELANARLSDFSVNDYDRPVIGYIKKIAIRNEKMRVYEHLAEIYEEREDFRKVSEYTLLWMNVGDELFWERNQNLITWMGSVSENEKTRNRIALLARDNELHKMQVKQSRIWLIAMGAFVLVLILVSMLFIRQRRTRLLIREQKLLHDLEIKEVESKKLKELDAMKSRFFANISHEFRTPLTLIMRPLEKVLSKIEDPHHKKDLDVAKKYAGNLQDLINNLLALSKLESGKMQLHAAETDIIKLVNNYVQAFDSLAKQKNITLNFITEKENIEAYIDREKFEQVLNNLLSNAFKFTGEGGRIVIAVGIWPLATRLADGQVSNGVQKPKANSPAWPAGRQELKAKADGQWAEIKISDTGRGIPPDHLNHIFDRFYQVSNDDNNHFEGTGIGLALTKELVELHHGKIEVESEAGKGTTFTITLPVGREHLKDEEISIQKEISNIEHPISNDDLTFDISEKLETSNQKPETSIQKSAFIKAAADDATQPILLIAEDNTDMRTYIREYFEKDYHVIEAIDGLDGLEKSIDHIPDIIISDVMMPRMDGNEFCSKVKSDERTSHIPVILLTAKALKESRIEGLETGADDYITKPFDGEELMVRVKNLIKQRKRISLKLESEIRKKISYAKIDFKESDITSMDEIFLQKVIKTVNEQFSNPEFNAMLFSKRIGLSRVQLHRKMKALTGQSTGEFIRTFRLTRAAELIKKESGTVAEIAYDVGFSSPSYFSECFKNHFGKLPSEYNGGTK